MDANKTLYPNAKERQENKNRRAKYIAKVQKLEKERIKLVHKDKDEYQKNIITYEEFGEITSQTKLLS